MCSEVEVLSRLNNKLGTGEAIYVGAAGFEDRATKTLKTMIDLGIRICGAIIMTYDNGERLEENIKNLAEMKRLVLILSGQNNVTCLPISEISRMDEVVLDLDIASNTTILLDITAMSHLVMFRALAQISRIKRPFVILYTEAEHYRPFKHEVAHALKCDTEHEGFLALIEKGYEQTEVMFKGNYNVIYVPEFSGNISPQLPSVLVVFPTFKRVRISTIIAPLEVNHKALVFGISVRDDLKWRTRLLRMINYDLMEPSTDTICEISTLSPHTTYQKLLSILDGRSNHGLHNTIIVPFGSKMQTVGVWKYCQEHPEVRIVLSQPKEFYPNKYSDGAKDSFFFDPNLNWPSLP